MVITKESLEGKLTLIKQQQEILKNQYQQLEGRLVEITDQLALLATPDPVPPAA